MAVTIHQTPDSYMPAGNELVISASSSQEAQDLFRYKIRLYRDNTVIQTLLYPPRPETGVKFDPARFLQNELSFDISKMASYDPTIGFINTTVDNVFVTYKVDFIEQYGADQLTYASAQVSGLTAINGSLQWQQWFNLTIADYIITPTIPPLPWNFLTNSPRTLKVGFSERLALDFMQSVAPDTTFPNPMAYTIVKAYNEAGVLISNKSIENSAAFSGEASKFQSIFVGPADLNIVAQSQFGTDAVPSNTFYYQVWLANDDTEERTTEFFTFYIDDLCTRYITYRLHFLNRWGRIDSFTFKGDSDSMVDAMDKEPFTRAPGYSDGNSWLYSASRHSMVNYATPYTDKWILKAAFVTVEEKAWLEELMTSPAVWWQAGANGDPTTMWAVNIKRTTDYKKEKHGLFSATFEMKLSTGSMAQNR